MTRSLIEHLALFALVCGTLEELLGRLEGQNASAKIERALENAETLLRRSYYGSNVVTENSPAAEAEAIHTNDCLEALKADVADIFDMYAYLCEYVHPNHGSNRLVSKGELGLGELEPSPECLNSTIDRMATYVSLSLDHFTKSEMRLARACILIDDLAERTLQQGTTVRNWLSKRPAKPSGDGLSKETAYFFPRARTASEAIQMIYEFLAGEEIEITGPKMIGAVEQNSIYDVFQTSKGPIWFRVPTMRLN